MRARKFCSRDCSFKYRKNERHHAWKGKRASYSAIHKWMQKEHILPQTCFYCCGKKPRIEWANISGEYLRELNDWIHLCSSCHRYFDRNKIWREKILDKFYTGKKAVLEKAKD